MVLTDGKDNGNVLAVDEEVNTIVGQSRRRFGRGDELRRQHYRGRRLRGQRGAERWGGQCHRAVEGGQRHHIIEATDGSGAVLLALMATSSRPGTPRATWC